jgi:hypothetical protein
VHWEDEIPFEVQVITRLFGTESDQLQNFTARLQKRPQQKIMNIISEKLAIFNLLNDPGHAYALCLGCMGDFKPAY